ncbi:hypothetical protein [Mycolicibacterium fortuitum]|uniref:hypothetical protein n=1 Tax=Mycolicibacterium fortuitum TaxID=1766 RepID=UPI001CDB4FFC|nr:hypothetical protein [Mycolicibacterium fortuitum]UBV17757.1 hypothetical protein H8Z57_13790 [Mycolicibacterium fortuitum]
MRSVLSQLFLLESDLAPLLVLAVCLTARNVETLKELPADHTVLDDRAVSIVVTKRRRRKELMFETVHWEIGKRSSVELKTPGAFYLLLHELTERGRYFSKSKTVWSVWRASSQKGPQPAARHIDPFADDISHDLRLRIWVDSKQLRGDDGLPLKLQLSRLKKTEDIRRTRSLGGHLPSAALTNGIDTLFRDYLAGDTSVREWADDTVERALHEAEAAARNFAPRVLGEADENDAHADSANLARTLSTTQHKVSQALSGRLDTEVASCLDFDHHPDTGKQCTASFSTCLMCSNALVMERHLPALLAMLHRLEGALDGTDAETWCRQHGVLWLVLTRHVLPRFTEAQRCRAPAPTADVLAVLDGLQES